MLWPCFSWLAERRADAGLWHEFVPVAWHVTYWDRLGWPDRFAQQTFNERQLAHASRWHSESVYTPCFVRNGAEWRPGRTYDPRKPAGVLHVRYDAQTGALEVEFHPVTAPPDRALEVHAVQLGGGLVSLVKVDENAGATLRHEFVALAALRGELIAAGNAYHVALTFPVSVGPAIPRRALAVGVTRRGELAPLQATGGWFIP
jgi:hypothetical protein